MRDGFPTWFVRRTGLPRSTTIRAALQPSTAWGQLATGSGGSSSPALPPSAPTGFIATAGNKQVSLTWNASAGGVELQRLQFDDEWEVRTARSHSVTTPSYTNTGLTNGTTYYYVVTAVNSSGPSGNSNQASAMPTAGSSWSNGYTNMRAITINHTQVPNTDQTNFPVLISLPANTYADLKTTANGGSVTNANGYDILFTSDAAGTLPLAYERESYNGATGAMNDWVNVRDGIAHHRHGDLSVLREFFSHDGPIERERDVEQQLCRVCGTCRTGRR